VLETSARLLRLLSLFQNRRDWTGTELAKRLEVSTRTVRNDVQRLRQLGYQVDATTGATGGYRLGTSAVMPPLLLDDEEAVAVALGLHSAAGGSVAGIEEASVRALAKMRQLLPVPLRRRVSALEAFSVHAPDSGPTVDADMLTTLASACRDHEQTRIDYRRRDGTESSRTIEPHRLVNAGRRWYLVAWDEGRENWRTFRVDRIRLPQNHAGRRFVPRQLPDDDPAAYVMRGMSMAWPYQVSVIAFANAETVLSRLPQQTVVEPIDGNSCRVELSSETPQVLAAWLGMLGVDFDIENREGHPELVERLSEIGERYRRVARAPLGVEPVAPVTKAKETNIPVR
jgi:predicted DNA-binding transcriptional regulator YafY